LKLNSDDQSLAENKVLILYILSKVGKSISHKELLELVISILDMNYFYFEQFLLDLIEDNYLAKYTQENDDIYELTEEGKQALDLTLDILPGILKLKVDSKFKENFDSIKDKYSISAEYSPITETDFAVKCKIIENNKTIFHLELNAGSREQAKKIVNNWNQNASTIYSELFKLLVESQNTENNTNN
jgi:DNA-binding PadR family transcriptional regulator